MSGITTHVLDTSAGRPAAGVPVELAAAEGEGWIPVSRTTTDDDGRAILAAEGEIESAGRYRVRFDVEGYLAGRTPEAFYPSVDVVFNVSDPSQHHHVPLLISPFGYTTYRGS